jgi:type III pantothenate kinase
MLIAIDIGNSLINIGFFTDSGLFVGKIDTRPRRSHLDYFELLNKLIKEKNMYKKPEGGIISSVVPGHTRVWKKTLEKLTSSEPLIVSYKINTGLKFDIPNPEKLGSDRITNAVAAYEIFKGPVAVIDFGTATTISVIGKNANYIGGAIMPGIGLMNDSLAKGTSKLPKVSFNSPESALGTDTSTCIQSGLFYGTAGAAERLIQEMEKEIGFWLEVVVTGGYSGMVSRFLKRKHVLRQNLTLEGLRIIFSRNRNA